MAKKNKTKTDNFAVVSVGSKQYVVQEGDIIQTELIEGVSVGDEVKLDTLMRGSEDDAKVGSPALKKKVRGEVVEKLKGDKVEIIRFKAKKRHMRRKGHRQQYLKIEVTDIG